MRPLFGSGRQALLCVLCFALGAVAAATVMRTPVNLVAAIALLRVLRRR